jgi:hypothetical protein
MLGLFIAVVALLLTVGAAAAQAATTRYVSTPAHGGNDNSGANTCASSATPCATIGQAVSKASSGDTIRIGPGQFSEAVSATTKALTFIGAGSGTVTAYNSATETEIDATTTNKPGMTFGSKNETVEGIRIEAGQHTDNYQAVVDPGASTATTLTLSHCVAVQVTIVASGFLEGPAVDLGANGTGVNLTLIDSTVIGLGDGVVETSSHGSIDVQHSLIHGEVGNPAPSIATTTQALYAGVNATVVGSVLIGSTGLVAAGPSTLVVRSEIESSGVGVFVVDENDAPVLNLRDSIVTPYAGTLTEGVIVGGPAGTDTVVPSVNLTFDSVLARQSGSAIALGVSKATIGTHVNTYNTILRAIDTSGGSGNDDIATGTQALNWNINYTDYTQTSGVGVPAPGSGTNFDVQPHFVDDDGSDLRLSSSSTLFDKGDSAVVNSGETDITGAPRSLAHTCGSAALPDVGAFEAPAPGSCPPPTATLTTPSNGATYTQGQRVSASYSCGAPPAPATLAACVGTVIDGADVANGAAIDTSLTGTYTFTVTATSNDGSTATTSSSYTVKPAPPPKPSLGSIKASHKTFRTGNKLASIAKAKKKPPVGTTFSFVLNTTATLKLSFAEQLKGRKVKHKCEAPSKRNAHDHSCKLSQGVGSLTLSGHAGTDKVSFQGRLSKHKKLKAGTYTLTISATNASGKSRSRSVTFTIAG